MYNLISRYMTNLSEEDVFKFATSKDVHLSPEELSFTYNFIKKNWEQVIKNPSILNLERYRDKYSPENFNKIKKLFHEYSARYQAFLG